MTSSQSEYKAGDRAQAELAALPIRQGQRYLHYKGGEYEVIALAIQEDTLDPLVVYRSLAKNTIWVRTLKNWNEEVEVDGKKVKRFAKK